MEPAPLFSEETSRSQDTDLTWQLSSLGLNGGIQHNGDSETGESSPDDGHMEDLESSDIEDKEARLREMFPTLERYTITHALKKSNGVLQRAMDVLLNQVFFEEQDAEPTGERGDKWLPKGIDGFALETGHARGRKRKGKRRNILGDSPRSRSTASSVDEDGGSGVDNRWQAAKDDVEFIHSRTTLTIQEVTSAYHANGASLAATIHALSSKEINASKSLSSDDSVIQMQVAELRQDFPDTPPSTLERLLVLAQSSISAAHELTEVMMRKPQQNAPSIRIVTQVTPIEKLLERESATSHSAASWTKVDYRTARSLASAHGAAGQAAFAKASSAYTRSKSDHLMGGAASYYSAVGREHTEAAKRLAAAAADAHVNEHSSATELDLHGVSVPDAVRIAKVRVRDWWEGLGDAKYAPGGGGPERAGYHIVTGMGRHSKDGAPKIGPAVGRMLVREGWMVEVGEGMLIVTGTARRR